MNYQYTKTPLAYDRLEQEIKLSSITIATDRFTAEGGVTTVHFKTSISNTEKLTLDTIVANHTGMPLEPIMAPREVVFSKNEKTELGILKVSTYEAFGDSSTIVSHDFSKPTSWFQFSKPIVKEALTLVTGNTFISSSARINWIDLFHGKVYDEDNVVIQNPGKYDVKIYLGDVIQAANTYTVNYEEGKITFNGPVVGAVTGSFFYSDKSYYTIKPKPGKILSINAAEVQFSAGTLLNSAFVFEAWATINHPVYGVMTVQVPGSAIYYKNAKDFISACNEGQGLIPAWGELTKDVHVFPFNYARPKPMKASQNVEIRVYCKNHLPVSSEMATATFYVTIDNEVVL